MNKNDMTLVVVSVVSLGVGGVSGYFFAKKKFERYANEEIESVKDTYNRRYKDGAYSTPESAAAVLIPEDEDETEIRPTFTEPEIREYTDTVESLDYSREEAEQVGLTVVNNVFVENLKVEVEEKDETIPEWTPTREPHKPYVITEEEYMTTENDWDKLTMMYYEEDDSLADDREQLVSDVEAVVGDEALDHFGYGTNQKNAVYVRNPRISSDIEILRDKRSYQEVVIGIPREKTKKSPVRRMREGDDG